ncbi:MAG: tetratricopeptide repeat protein [Bacteroidales bacterium]|nr:tetratricopeptide repeat protein [Bacteroidales bacterium]
MRRFAIISVLFLWAVGARAQTQTPKEQSVVESLVIDAAGRLQQGDVQTAFDRLSYLNRKYPGNDAVNYYLGICYISSGQADKAEEHLRAAVKADSTNVWYKDCLASVLLNEGKTAESTQMYLSLMEKYPGKYTNAYTLTLLGNNNLAEYKDSLAMTNFENALKLSPGYVPAILGQSEVYRFRRNYPAFFSSVGSMVADASVNPQAKCEYVNQILRHIDYNFYTVWKDQLDTLVNTCAAVHPGDSSAIMLAGSWYYSTDRKEKGIKYFEELLKYYPQDLNSHFIKLQMMMNSGSTAREIIDECEEIVRIGGEQNPKVLPALATIGDTYWQVGQSKNAYKAYKRALKADPEYLPVLNNYAWHLCEEGKKLKKAEQMSRITIEKDPDNATYLDTYGWILYLRGQYQKAKPIFKHAMLYGGRESSTITWHYAKVLEALGEKDLAKSFYMLSENKKKEGK